jgi:hypothetical protein
MSVTDTYCQWYWLVVRRGAFKVCSFCCLVGLYWLALNQKSCSHYEPFWNRKLCSLSFGLAIWYTRVKIWAKKYDLKCAGNWEQMETWVTIGSDVGSYQGNLVGTWWQDWNPKNKKNSNLIHKQKKLSPPQCILSPPQSSLSLLVLLGKEGNESLELMVPVRV